MKERELTTLATVLSEPMAALALTWLGSETELWLVAFMMKTRTTDEDPLHHEKTPCFIHHHFPYLLYSTTLDYVLLTTIGIHTTGSVTTLVIWHLVHAGRANIVHLVGLNGRRVVDDIQLGFGGSAHSAFWYDASPADGGTLVVHCTPTSFLPRRQLVAHYLKLSWNSRGVQ